MVHFLAQRKHFWWATRVHFSACREHLLWAMSRGVIGKSVSGEAEKWTLVVASVTKKRLRLS